MVIKPWSAGASPSVGRAGELSLLRRWSDEARQGQPRAVLIEGEGGFGKSALLSRFLTGLDQVCVLRASGDEAEALLAYAVVALERWPGPAHLVDGGDEPVAAAR